MCNVLEDYSNIVILGTLFFYMAFVQIDRNIRKICLFLFIINAFDFIHLGLMDMQGFIAIKLLLSYLIFNLCSKLRIF